MSLGCPAPFRQGFEILIIQLINLLFFPLSSYFAFCFPYSLLSVYWVLINYVYVQGCEGLSEFHLGCLS